MVRFVDVDRFDGGLVDSSIDIGDESINMLRYGQNIRIRGGAVKDRDGITEYCDFHLAVGIMGLNIGPIYEYRREAGTIYYAIVFSVGDDYYYVEVDDPNVAVAIDTLSNGDFYALNYYDHLFIANGEDNLKIWNGNNLYNVGIDAPPDPFDYDDCAGATPLTYCKFKYTYYSDTDPYIVESNPSEEIEVLVLTDEALDFDFTLYFEPSVDSRVTHIRLYSAGMYGIDDKDTPDEPTQYVVVAELDPATASITYAEIQALNGFFTNFIAADHESYNTSDRSTPPVIKYILEVDNVIFGAGNPDDPSVIYYCQTGKPWYWPINNWDEINRDDGDILTGIGAIGLVKFIFKQNSIYQWSGHPELLSPIVPVERPDATHNMVRLGIGCK